MNHDFWTNAYCIDLALEIKDHIYIYIYIYIYIHIRIRVGEKKECLLLARLSCIMSCRFHGEQEGKVGFCFSVGPLALEIEGACAANGSVRFSRICQNVTIVLPKDIRMSTIYIR